MREELAGMFDFFSAASSRVLAAAKSVVLELHGDGDGTVESVAEAETFGEAAVLYRPAAPDSTGALEALCFRRGDEVVVVATKERRWQVTLEEGEVVVRGFGANAARVHLKADGTAIVEATMVKLGGAAAADFAALASVVDSDLAAIRTAYNLHTHGGVTVGAGVTAVPLVPLAAASPTACSKVKIQ